MKYFIKVLSRALLVLIVFVNLGLVHDAGAAALAVNVTDTKGRSVKNAVVSLKPLFTADWSKLPVADVAMRQQKALFNPFVLAVRTNTPVSFPNLDKFRHQVYSFSKAKRFELRLYGKDESKEVIFDKAGIVALGCNIHDNMLAYIYVADAPYVEKSDRQGSVFFADVVAGDYAMTVWHPDQKKRRESYQETIQIGFNKIEKTIPIKLRSVRRIQKPAEIEAY